MKKHIFIVNGRPGSGKDTFCDLVAKYSDSLSISSVDKIKEVATTLGWSGIKDDKSRKMLSDLKDLSTVYNDGPFKYCYHTATEAPNSIVFIHVRELTEITKLKDAINELKDLGYVAQSLQIDRAVKVTAVNTGDSDTLLAYNYDIVIDNNGSLEELEYVAIQFAETFMSKRSHVEKV